MGIKDWLLSKTVEAQVKTMPSCDAFIGKVLSDMQKNIGWHEKKHGQKPTVEELSEVYLKSKMFMAGAKSYGFIDRDIMNFAADALKGE
jgi:hypothetical protein